MTANKMLYDDKRRPAIWTVRFRASEQAAICMVIENETGRAGGAEDGD